MNAIDQYVAPAPPRPSSPSAQAPRAGSDASASQTFGDVYNKAANGNQANSEPAATQQTNANDQQPEPEAIAPEAGDKALMQGEATSTVVPGAGSAILALAAEAKPGKIGKNGDAGPEGSLIADPEAASADEAPQVKADVIDHEKMPGKAAAEPTPASDADADAAAIALKLLGADVASKGQGKTAQVKDAGKADDPAKPDKDKETEIKAEGVAPEKEGDNTLLAALAVEAAGERAKDPQDQAKPKPQDLSARTTAAAGTQTQGGTTGEITKTASTGETVKPESITVLDARRFVGSGEMLSANTQAVMSGVTGDGDWAAAMKAASAAANAPSEPRTATPVNTLKIQMTPESLGNVTATLRLHGDQLTVQLTVESGEAFKQLSHDKEGLIQSLKSQGFSVDQVSVQLTPAPTSDKAVAQTSSGQQTGGQMQDGSSAGQFAQQGREQDNNRRQQDNGFNANWQGDDKSVAADAVTHAADTARTGQVYL